MQNSPVVKSASGGVVKSENDIKWQKNTCFAKKWQEKNATRTNLNFFWIKKCKTEDVRHNRLYPVLDVEVFDGTTPGEGGIYILLLLHSATYSGAHCGWHFQN